MSNTPFVKTDCPSGGAPVEAHSATAVTLVCGYCNSMLVREDGGIVDSGRDSALLEDFSPLQIGTTGKFFLRDFTLIGRLQVHYDNGSWNEWYALFHDGGYGWLSEAGDLYVLTIADEAPIEVPAFHDVRAGFSTLNHNGKTFTAADVREITLKEVAAQGELPFKVSSEMNNRVVDWRCEQLFLTTDYADAPPAVFSGRMVQLDALQLTHTRSDDQIRESAGRLKGERQSENCPNCGSPVHWISGISSHLICPSCSSELDVSRAKAELMAANTMRQAQEKLFLLPVGSQGRLKGRDYYVMGAVRYSETDAQDTFDNLFGGSNRVLTPESWWAEYLLYNPQHGFSWLVQTADGEWSVSETLTEWPRLNRNGKPQGCPKLYDYGGQVEVAAGAFYWHIRNGDVNYYSDYGQGSGKLCRELSANELAWSKSTPITYNEVAKAFGLQAHAAPVYTAKMQADGITFSLRMLFTVIFVVVNLPAWLMMSGDQFWDDSFISSALGLGLIWWLGANSSEE